MSIDLAQSKLTTVAWKLLLITDNYQNDLMYHVLSTINMNNYYEVTQVLL